MPRRTVSIVMAAYKRSKQLSKTLESIWIQTRQADQIVVVEDGFDGGATRDVCALWAPQLPVEYYSRKNRPNVIYANPAIPKNCGIRKATGDILIIQDPEVMFTSPNDIENLVRPVEAYDLVSIYAPCDSLDKDGQYDGEQMAGPGLSRHLGAFIYFCQVVSRKRVLAIGGVDEQYQGYGFEDGDFSERLWHSGVYRRWSSNVRVQHQWHPRDGEVCVNPQDRLRHKSRFETKFYGNVEANRGKEEEWGYLES